MYNSYNLIKVCAFLLSLHFGMYYSESMSRLTSIVFNDESILKVLMELDVNKAHGYEDVSIRMIKLCDKFIILAISLSYMISMINLFINWYNESININSSTQEFFLIYGRNPMLPQLIRRVIHKLLAITDHFYFYQFLVKSWKACF